MTNHDLPPPRRPLTFDEELLSITGPGVELLTGDDPARVDRIATEMLIGFHALADVDKGVSIFGSARTPTDHPEYELARSVAQHLGQRGFTIITGGGPGAMEAANRGARDAGARSIGLNIELPFEQHLNPYLDVSIEFKHFYLRKLMFVRYAAAFVVLPGGFGTFDELFEALVLIQTGKIPHFPVVLMGAEFWRPLIDWLERTVLAESKVSPDDLELLHVTDDVDEAADIVERAWHRQTEATLGRTEPPA